MKNISYLTSGGALKLCGDLDAEAMWPSMQQPLTSFISPTEK